MLNPNILESNIPHCTTIQKMVWECFLIYMHKMKKELKMNTLGKITFSTNGWTDSTVFPFIAVIAHYIKCIDIDPKLQSSYSSPFMLQMKSVCVGFHTSAHLCSAFINILDRVDVTEKIGYVSLDNASNNTIILQEVKKELRIWGIEFHHINNHIR
ncbi:hypothetical protein PM082_016201 [Marasmius tenuissimus]|nr:hypothetical protein PM082_016201 [Marasmius tenuissimus]